MGVFKVYWNGVFHAAAGNGLPKFAPNTHSATTLGYKPGLNVFNGYIDDVRFALMSVKIALTIMYLICILIDFSLA